MSTFAPRRHLELLDGISDDEKLDRISDFDLFHRTLSPIGPGREISVAWMKGRSRPFSIGGACGEIRALGRVQRSLRCDHRNRGAWPRHARSFWTGCNRISQQPDGHRLG
jgi:hypothetical protein